MHKMGYGFDMRNGLPVICIHVFSAANDGQIEHHIDGRLRAVIPPEGWRDYFNGLSGDCREAFDSVALALTLPSPVSASAVSESIAPNPLDNPDAMGDSALAVSLPPSPLPDQQQ